MVDGQIVEAWVSADQTDRELLGACSQGHSASWDTLVERYKRLVYSIPLRAGLTAEDAADVFQTVFTQLFQHLNTIREPEKLAGWLITTAKRESWNVSRKRRREPANDEIVETRASLDTSAEHPNEGLWADQALVRQALAQVGDVCSELLRLLYFDPKEPSYDEISGRLQMPLGSIGPTRARCLARLRKILQTMGMSGHE
jgi:RNA polymerase sigma factor (sigma-70 family)